MKLSNAQYGMLAGLALVCSFGFACSKGAPPPAHAEHGEPGAHGDHGHHVHWGYAKDVGPGHWGDLEAEFASCKTGQQQSPIDIAKASGQAVGPITFEYKKSGGTIVNNGHTIQVNVPPGSQVRMGGQTFPLAQFHFHAPSEHTVEGKAFPMEMHLVHKTAEGRIAVIGVLIESGSKNEAFEVIWNAMPSNPEEQKALGDNSLDPTALLPKDLTQYHYSGSLTTPPCSEGVDWSVIKTPIQLSPEQIAKFKALYPMNARPVQPVNSRKIDG